MFGAFAGFIRSVFTLLYFQTCERLTRSLVNLLSSTTSQSLRKVSLSFAEYASGTDSDLDLVEDAGGDEGGGMETWGAFDAALSRLAEQVSEVEGKLILQFNIPRLGWSSSTTS